LIEYFDRPNKNHWGLLTSKEIAALEEQIRKCASDFVYAAKNYFWITTKETGDKLFSLWESQELIFEELLRLKAKGRAQKLIILKSRQLGCSTLLEALLGWNAMFFPNTNGLVVSRDRPHAAYLFGIMLHIYDMLPWWLKPMTASLKIEDGLAFDNPDPEARRLNPGLHSRVDVMAATQEAGIGQGRMLTGVHVSEIGDYPDNVAREMIEGDLKHALSPSVKAFATIESTAKGAGRYYHLLWKKNIELAERADWSCLFLPWFFEKTRVIAPEIGWRPDTPEAAMRERIKDEWTQCDNPDCGSWKEAFSHGINFTDEECPFCRAGTLRAFELTDPQLRFIWQERINAEKDKRSIKEHKQELCSTSNESFQISGYQIFSQEILDFVDRSVRKPLATGFLDSKGIFHGVKQIKRDPSTKQELGSQCWQEHCDLDHRFDCDGRMPLKIWEFPEPGKEYVCGVDVAEGLGGSADYSVVFINRIGTAPSPDVHVATWRSNEIDPIGFATPVNQLGRWYNDALMSIEYNKYDTCANTVRYQFQYPNLFRWKHLDSIKNPIADKYHWYTQYNTKFRLWQTAVKWLRAGLWIVRDEVLADELKTFQKEEAEERSAEAAQGFFDDVAISAFIALYTSHDMDWSEEVNAVVIRNDPTQGTTGDYRMHCTKCGNEWDTDDPNAWSHPHVGCPNCRNIILRATKQGVMNGHTTQVTWEDMAKEPTAATDIPEYNSL
jgi:hypothetical protein